MAPSRSWLAALVVLGAGSSFAQAGADGGTAPATDVETLRRELEATRKDLKEMREEVRAQLATQSATQGWSEDFVEEKRKLEVFVPNGYFRTRPELFYKLDLGRAPDPSGYTTFPIPPTSPPGPGLAKERTEAGVNMRFRFEPTFNVSEEVRIRMQIDALDNVMMGATPDYAFSRDPNHVYDRDGFSIMSDSIAPPRSGLNALGDSIAVKRIWGEVSTPIGILRFGRMGSNWGLGLVHNDGNCLDCDFGDTVDRVMFVAEPLAGYYITPMIDINAEGPSSYRAFGGGEVFDSSNSDDAHSAIIALARRDTETQTRARLEAGQTVFNYGVHLTYRWQRNDPADYYGQPFTDESATNATAGYVPRNAQMWTPDIWVKFQRGNLRLELEAAAVIGNITNGALTGADANTPGKNQGLGIQQFGGALQGEYKLLDGALSIAAEVGIASGDEAAGFGNYPRRKVAGADNITQPGDIDGPQYACQNTGGCTDSMIRNFRFNRDYRIDLILFREIIGGVTDAFYAKPTVTYRIADGLTAWGSVIYSRSLYFESTPSYHLTGAGEKAGDANLGLEIDFGARYETEDGFFGDVRAGVLFPLGGFSDTRPTASGGLDSPWVLRGAVGIKF